MHEKLKRFFAENWATAGEGSSETSTSCEKLYNLGHHLDHKPSSFREQTDLGHNLEHKKLHAKRPIRSTIWSTKSCTRNDPSGARFGAQKVARETTHAERENWPGWAVVSEGLMACHTDGLHFRAQVQNSSGVLFFLSSCI